MLESKVNQKSIHGALDATIDPFTASSNDREVRLCQVVWRTSAREHRQEFGCLENAIEFKDRLAPTFKEGAHIVDSKTGEVIDDSNDEQRACRSAASLTKPNTPLPGSEGIPFDAEILYARKAVDTQTHPELSRIETKFRRKIIGSLYTSKRGKPTLQCDTDGHKSVLECDVSFEALLTLPNLREPCKVTPIPDTTQFVVFDDLSKPGYVVTPEEEMCGCQLIFNHEYECRHLKAVHQYQMEHAVAFRKVKTTAADIRNEANDIMNDLVAEHHPNSLAAADQLNGMPVYCAICARELTNPESRRIQIGPICREKVGMKGEAHLRGNFISKKLVEASRLYKDAKLQNRILQGCLQLDAPIPVEVIPQKDTEYWSLKRSPRLYYLSKDYKAHCLYKVKRKLKYKRLTAQCRDTELDQMAWNAAKNLIECLEANGGKKPRTICL